MLKGNLTPHATIWIGLHRPLHGLIRDLYAASLSPTTSLRAPHPQQLESSCAHSVLERCRSQDPVGLQQSLC